jgi:hypothetical protein
MRITKSNGRNDLHQPHPAGERRAHPADYADAGVPIPARARKLASMISGADDGISAELAGVLDEVVGEAILIVQDE